MIRNKDLNDTQELYCNALTATAPAHKWQEYRVSFIFFLMFCVKSVPGKTGQTGKLITISIQY
jgi:hypothetical protein